MGGERVEQAEKKGVRECLDGGEVLFFPVCIHSDREIEGAGKKDAR